jgi:hypothetical protein
MLSQFPTIAPYRGYASRVFLPNEHELNALGDKMPYAFKLFDSATLFPATGTLASQQTARDYSSQPEECFITHLVGSSSQAAGFVVQFYDTLRQKLWTPQPILFADSLGSAKQPFWLKKIYRLPANAQLQCRVINLATVANAIQVVAWGVRD